MRSGKVWIAAVILLACSMASLAQNNPNTDQGMKPFDSFHGGTIDSVSITSGNLMFHAPLYSLPQRGRAGLNFSMIYNNKGFRLQTTCPPPPQHGCTYTWHFSGGGVAVVDNEDPHLGLAVTSSRVDTGSTDGLGGEVFATIYSAKTIDGSVHQMADTGNGYRSVDGSGILWNSSTNGALDRSGIYSGGLHYEDPNGNYVTYNLDASFMDTLGRAIPAIPTPATTSTASLSSCPQLSLPYQPVTFAYVWNLPGPTGSSQFLLCYASVFIRTAFFGSTYTNTTVLHDVNQSFSMLQSVVLPNGTVWTFQYDGANPNDTTSLGYGDLVKIGFPTGGSLSYTYTTLLGYQGAYYTSMATQQSRSVTTRTLDANDGNGPHQWSYNWNTILAATNTTYTIENKVTDPLLNDTVHVVSGLFGGPSLFETQTRFYQGSKSSGALLKTVNTDYSYSSNPFDTLSPTVNPPTAINVMPIRVTTIWPNGQTSKVETDYDSAFTFRDPTWGLSIYPPEPRNTATYSATLGTVAAQREYDYGPGSAGALLSQTFTTYRWQGNSSYLSANMLDLPATVKVQNGAGNLCAETDTFYDEVAPTTPSPAISMQHTTPPAGVRGNATTVTHKLSSTPCQAGATWTDVSSHGAWFDTGEVQSSTDPLGHSTTHLYDSVNYGAYPTQSCSPSTNGGTVTHCVSGTYDFNSGLIQSFTDQNGQTGNFTHDSSFRLLTAIGPADSSGLHPETDFTFPTVTSVQRSKRQDTSHWITDSAGFDGVGRTIQTRLTDPEGDDLVDTTYDQLGRVSTVSNPHRSIAGPTDGTTTTLYDPLGRVTQVTKQDGSVSTISYAGSCATAQDEAGKQRKSCSDALGRLTQVFEAPTGLNYETDYQYDALGNLLRVDQKGSAPTDSTQWRTRTFTYDSLSRLLTAVNPESGTISYSYDADGNLLQKTSPAPNQGGTMNQGTATQTVSFCYDELHRVTGKGYGAQSCPLSSPVVSYVYDSGANAKGKIVSLTDQAGTASYTYDILGRLATETRSLTGANNAAIYKNLSYAYNLDGSLKALTYPSGAVVTYTPDSAGRTLSAVDSGYGINYATGATYGPDGALTGFVNGNSASFAGISNAYTYNKRLQPVNMSATAPSQTVYSIGYDFHVGNGTTGTDNGNVFGITNYKDTSHNRDQTFTYDALNRLTSAQNAGTVCTAVVLQNKTEYWGNSYTYDAWGNLLNKTITKCGAENLSVTADAHNWIHATAPPDYQYDAAGNMTFNATPPTQTYTYDQENRLTGAAGYTFTYDADGNRVRKSNGNTAGDGTLYWAMTPGVVAETDLAGTTKSEYIFFDGERVARRDGATGTGGVFYYFSDHLKTASVITDSAGVIKAESDYYPWGGELQFVNNDSNHYKFTGKERDETGLDYFGARYYSNGLGRWVSADWSATPVPVPYADLTDPQSLNLYGYVRGLPTTTVDLDGHGFWSKFGNEFHRDGCWCEDDEYKKQHEETLRAEKEWQKGEEWVMRDSPSAKQWAKEHGGMSPLDAVSMGMLTVGGAQAGYAFGPEPTATVPPAEEGGTTEVTISKSQSPVSAQHIDDAQAAGKPSTVTLDRSGTQGATRAAARGRAATAGTPTSPGMDRDEYPPKCCAEGGSGASVRLVPSGDNRSAGAQLGNQIKNLPDGTKIKIKTGP